MPLVDFLDYATGCAYVTGFKEGFTAARNGEEEPCIVEIQRRFESIEKEANITIEPRAVSHGDSKEADFGELRR